VPTIHVCFFVFWHAVCLAFLNDYVVFKLSKFGRGPIYELENV